MPGITLGTKKKIYNSEEDRQKPCTHGMALVLVKGDS